MLSSDPKIKELMYESAVVRYSKLTNLPINESRKAISLMSFSDYLKLLEASADITPPSGMKIGASTPSNSSSSASAGNTTVNSSTVNTQKAQQDPTKTQVIWNGPGSPIEKGMTVGLKGPTGIPVPGEITQVDNQANGVKVRNPSTNKEEWHSNDDLEPYVGGATPAPGLQTSAMAEELSRMKKLAGIAEDASSGASCAGAMGAGTPQPIGAIKRRQPVAELKKEYVPKVAKTVVGDTKPNQASGELSANLAASGKKTASRINNGIKK